MATSEARCLKLFQRQNSIAQLLATVIPQTPKKTLQMEELEAIKIELIISCIFKSRHNQESVALAYTLSRLHNSRMIETDALLLNHAPIFGIETLIETHVKLAW